MVKHPKYAIIVAAGTGTRFGGDIPKQYLPLGPDKSPVLMHTVRSFIDAGFDRHDIRVVISPAMSGFWNDLCRQHRFVSPPVVDGGATRSLSVRNALDSIVCGPLDTVLVHDGARPLATPGLIQRVLKATETHSSAIPVIPVSDSLRRRDEVSGNMTVVDRSRYAAVQTPQGFVARIIKEAYLKPDEIERYTDDASLVEEIFKPLWFVEGDPENIKITSPRDLFVAEAILSERDKSKHPQLR